MSSALLLAVVTLAAVPRPLSVLEQVAEAIDDAAVAQDWARVVALEERGGQALGAKALVTTSHAHAAATNALAEAKAATERRDALATRRAANRLAAAVVEFYDPLHPTVPTSVMRLDVLLRQLDLASEAGEANGARAALKATTSIWKTLRANAPVHGKTAAATFEHDLGAVRRALDAGDLQATAQAAVMALEGVDGLEKLFGAGTAR
ncbi:hypothetical protein AMYX_08000 [Anaeromyxobacter diazotrophicus]|uniref:Uncharacterized protein n=1 Tax=Anaeromyxobacter diazotrophicus TaxID=2590199 RepID=A0A7I9VIH6_9BACT|nr:hypothetical protein AMYX_08000 [Anaeromyxobacter diazotrophicus]